MHSDVRKLADDLAKEFEPAVPSETIQRVVADTLASLADARLKAYVPILARRFARERLQSLGRRVVA
jgi:hypothetical protein